MHNNWHIDDLKIFHRDQDAVEKILKQIEEVYRKMTVYHTDTHEYVGINFTYFRNEKAVEFDVKVYLEEAIADFFEDIDTIVINPTAIHLSDVNEEAEALI